MIRKLQISLSPEQAADETVVRKKSYMSAGIDSNEVASIRIIRKSIDARKKDIKVNLSIEIYTQDEETKQLIRPFNPKNVSNSREVIIVGAGPAGLFAALQLIESGLRPVILERGKDVSSRKVDIARISRNHIVDQDSNYCFGEGGAGTFSDGKLYTRSKKRGDNVRVLELLCLHGADEKIMFEAHPHLGTDRLPGIVSKIRKSITDAGGVLLFGKKVDDFIVNSGKISGVVVNGNEIYNSEFIILATGHSARDIYQVCTKRGVELQSKSFAMGVRVEHPQELIDKIQYHGLSRGKYLPPAEYNLVRQVEGRGVYSFCMCPGGFIVPAATSQEEVVVNGMSPSGRNSPYANSGIVVEIRPEDYIEYGNDPLAGLKFQEQLEQDAWIHGGRRQSAPAQRLTDFVTNRSSGSLPKVSYFPGVTPSQMNEWLPQQLSDRLREGFRKFGLIMKGFLTNEAVILGVESRTSSPVRIPRDPENLENVSVKNLYPCGEGSGYAGGIVSSAIDGIRAAEAIIRKQ
ncbi:MAG TPA: NAD(P)/FAD-dependent oxidoreductase [Bacteroidales bacterium]|nr:NAD(P)/FAD-dependent oxidoreductase [Bacteroidales bacterium]